MRILYILIAILLVLTFINSSTWYYDYDEFSHYRSLQNMQDDWWFNAWQRGGFKALYYPFKSLPLDGLRFINAVALLMGLYLLFIKRLRNPDGIFVVLSSPLVVSMGYRFYPEITAFILIVYILYFQYRDWPIPRFLLIGYLPLIRPELIVLWPVMVMYDWQLWRRKWCSAIILIPGFLYWVASWIVLGSPTAILSTYTDVASSSAHSGSITTYLGNLGMAFGIWGFMAWRGFIVHKLPLISVSVIIAVYSLMYWAGVGSIWGYDRHLIILAPFIAMGVTFISPMIYRKIAITCAFIVALLVGRAEPSGEMLVIDKFADQLPPYSKIVCQHPYLNHTLNVPLIDSRHERISRWNGKLGSGEYLIWDSHKAARYIPLDSLRSTYTIKGGLQEGNFAIAIAGLKE